MYKYLIGDSCVIAGLVCRPSSLSMIEYSESDFYKILENSLIKNGFEKYKDVAFKKSNLKKGITSGMDFFIIEKK